MKPTENIDEFVRLGKPHVTTSGEMDERTINDSFAAMDETVRAGRRSTAGTIFRSWAARLAAAAVIIVVSASLFMRNARTPNKSALELQPVTQSPAKLVSMISLRAAYQRGGWDALDRQFRDTLDTLGPGPSSLSMQQLLEGLKAF